MANSHLTGIIRPAISSNDAIATASSEHTNAKPSRSFDSRIIQNFILIWLHSRIDEVNDNDFRNSITELRRVVNTINTFTDTDECIDFVTDIRQEKVLMIISEKFSENIIPLIHDIIQINSIYIFCKNIFQHQKWPKVKGTFDGISSICQILKQDAQKCDRDSISISFVSTNDGKLNQNFDQLDSTFMYTQILKEILLKINFNQQHIKDFTEYYRENFGDNTVQLDSIDGFERDYDNRQPIWWYTHECCLYSVLNRALRIMEVDTIIKMGFFIRDLHQQIAQLHLEQNSKCHQSEPFTIYRGQALAKTDLDKMLKTQGGLISFNNFLSTSKDLSVALGFARSSLSDPASIGILFVMTINPSIKSTPFASINDVSYYKTEDEILFSMHTVFRIVNTIQIHGDNRLWQVDLTQTNDNDPQLNDLTERIRDEIRGSTEWDRLGKLLIKLGQYNKANELYQILLDQTNNDRQKMHFYNQLGWSKKKEKNFKEAIIFYEKSLEIKEKVLPKNHPSFTAVFNSIGSIYENMNEYSTALLYYERGLEVQSEIQSSDDFDLAASYSKIGSVYAKMDEYSKAISYLEKAAEIRQKILPSNNFNLAYSHNNIGSVYEKMGDYSKALSSHEKALEIQQQILPSNHPDLAQSHSNIGSVYAKMRQYSKARQSHQKAFDIGQRSLPVGHPHRLQLEKNLEYAKRKSN